MSERDLKALREEWYARARASGFQDIESPSGQFIRGGSGYTPGTYNHLRPVHLERARAFLLVHAFRGTFERQVWELHAGGTSNRQIARELGCNRKRVDPVIRRLTAAMEEREKRPRRGRPMDPEAIRRDGVTLTVRLSRAATMALDHLRSVCAPVGSLVRDALVESARRIPARPKTGGQ